MVIQGFGNVGGLAAELFAQAGAKIIGVGDSTGGIVAEDGLDLAAVHEHKASEGSVVGTPDTRTVASDDLLAEQCDILIPAALGSAIHGENADRVNAKLVVEAANGPITPDADDILNDKGIVVLPDIVANSGGVTVSYFEWRQNLTHENWNAELIDQRLKAVMTRTVDRVVDRWITLNDDARRQKEADPDIRTAALVTAIQDVANVTLKRGIWP